MGLFYELVIISVDIVWMRVKWVYSIMGVNFSEEWFGTRSVKLFHGIFLLISVSVSFLS